MKRSIEEKLIKWKKDPFRKPLLINGARQVGKTYVIKELFGPSNFKRVIYVDFRSDAQIRKFVKNHPSAKEIIQYISLNFETAINEDTLLFFDEIQEAVQILTAAKYFAQDYKNIPVIMAGSLVRVKLKQIETEKDGRGVILDPEISKENQDGHNNFLFPVGKIEELDIYPMTFDEFLLAYKPSFYQFLKDSFNTKVTLNAEYHQMAMGYFYDYLKIGGMPEVVDVFIQSGSPLYAQEKLRRIFDNYLSDMGLYQISSQTIARSRIVFSNIYNQLSKENKNYKISVIEEGKRFRDYMSSFDWLEIARLIYKCSQVKERVTLPLRADSESLFRIYLPDCGLFTIESEMNLASFSESLKTNTLSGIFMENFVAEELRARNIDLFYWKGKTSSEFEFLLNVNNTIVPMDVKKNRGTLNSLAVYKTFNQYKYSIKVSQNKYGFDKESGVYTIPFYYLPFLLNEYIEKGEIISK